MYASALKRPADHVAQNLCTVLTIFCSQQRDGSGKTEGAKRSSSRQGSHTASGGIIKKELAKTRIGRVEEGEAITTSLLSAAEHGVCCRRARI